jgi:hypothetical protein
VKAFEKWFTWQSKGANTILAGPTSGANAAPVFRSLVTLDIPFEPRFQMQEYDDFISNQGTSNLGWLNTISGAGAAIAAAHAANVNATDNAHGVFQLATGTTATGRAAISKALDSIHLGTNTRFIQSWRVNIPVLSTAAQEFQAAFGFHDGDTTANGDCVDGLYFKYNRLTNVNWLITSAVNSTITNTATAVAVATGWNWFTIDVNPATNTATFFINGTQVGTIARTSWPTAAGRNTGVLSKIVKTVGTTSVNLLLDAYAVRILRP